MGGWLPVFLRCSSFIYHVEGYDFGARGAPGQIAAMQQHVDSFNSPFNSGTHTVKQWFNTGALAQPAIYHFGNSGAGIMRAPGLVKFAAGSAPLRRATTAPSAVQRLEHPSSIRTRL